MTQPKIQNVRDLAIWAPKVALGMVLGIPRVPFVVDMPLQFSSSTVNAPPIETNFDNNLTQDTIIERISYSLVQQNSFPGSPFQSLFLQTLKAQTGVGIRCSVYGGPRYQINDGFTELANFADVLAVTWPQGWMLPKQSNVKVEAVLLSTPTSVPYAVNLTWLGWQSLSKDLDDLSDKEARIRLRRLGIESPDLDLLLMPPDARPRP